MRGRDAGPATAALRATASVFRRGWLRFSAVSALVIVGVGAGVLAMRGLLEVLLPAQRGLLTDHGQLTRTGVAVVIAETTVLTFAVIAVVSLAAAVVTAVTSGSLLGEGRRTRLGASVRLGLRRTPAAVATVALAGLGVVASFVGAPLVCAAGIVGLVLHPLARRWARWPSLRRLGLLAVPFAAAGVLVVRWCLVVPAAAVERGGPRRILARSAEAVRGRAGTVILTLTSTVAVVAAAYLGVRTGVGALTASTRAPDTAAALAAFVVVALPVVAATVLYQRGAGPLEPAFVVTEPAARPWDQLLTRGGAHFLVIALMLGALVIPVVDAKTAGAATLTPTTTTFNTALVTGTFRETIHAGEPVTVFANVDPNTATGTVDVREGTTLLGSAALSSGSAAVDIGALTAGDHTLRIDYLGSTTFAASAAVPDPVLHILPPNNTVVVNASPNPGTFQQPITITAEVGSTTGTPTGTVEFFSDGTSLGAPVTLDAAATATFTIVSAAVGQFAYTAHYSGDATHDPLDTVTSYIETVPSPTTLTLDGPSGAVTYGNQVTVTATVTSELANPSGTVTFTDGATALAAPVPVVGGQAAWTPDAHDLLPQTISVHAEYTPDTAVELASSATPVSLQVVAAGTSTGLTKSPAGSTAYGAAITFNATVTAAGSPADVDNGSVEFSAGGTSLGTDNVDGTGHASITVSSLGAGTHDVVAVYQPGTAAFTTSTSAARSTVVTAAPVTTFSLQASPSSIGIGGTSTLTATVTASPSAAGTVTFKDGTTTIGTQPVSGGTAAISPTFSVAGTHTITATFDGSPNFATPTPTTAAVEVAKLAPTITITPSSTSPFAGQSVGFTIVVSSGGPVPTGNVALQDGSDLLGAATLDGTGRATISVPGGFSAGTHALAVPYDGDTHVAGGTGTLSYVVVQVPTSATLAVNGPITYGAGMPVTVTVNKLRTTPRAPTGAVNVYRTGDVLLGQLVVGSNGVATGSVATPPAGAVSVYARYSGDADFEESPASPTVGVNVGSGTPVVTLAAPSPAPADTTEVAILRATAFGADGVTPATGALAFTAGATDLGGAPLVNGTATLTTRLPAGTFDLRAGYDGDANFAGALSNIRTLTVAKALLAVALTARPTPLGQPLTLDATVGQAGSVPAVAGTVTFFDGVTELQTATRTSGVARATYTVTLPAPSPGPHTYRAVFNGDDTYLTNTATLVRDGAAQPVLLSLGVSTPGTVGFPTRINVFATTAPLPPAGTVTLSDITGGRPGTPLGIVTLTDGSSQLFETSALPAGDRTVLGVFSPSTSALQSAEATTIVSRLKNPANLGITLPSVVHADEATPVTVTAAAVDAGGPSPVGGTTTVSTPDAGSCTVVGPAGSCPLTFPTAGAIETITASWTGDAAFDPATRTRSIVVAKRPAAIAATADPATGWAVGVPITFSWDARSLTGDVPAPDSAVAVRSESRVICTGTTALGTCQGALASYESGALTVTYSGTANWATAVTTINGGSVRACTAVIFRTSGARGTVHADPPPNCPGGWIAGTRLTVRVTPATGAELRSWSVTDSLGTHTRNAAADGSLAVVVDSVPMEVEAVLGVTCVPLTIATTGPLRVGQAGAPGNVVATAPNCGDEHPDFEPVDSDGVFGPATRRGWYLPGTAVTLEARPGPDPADTATPKANFVLYSWCEQPAATGAGACPFEGGADPPSLVRTTTFVRPVQGWTRTLTLTAPTVATAVFGPVCYPLTSVVTGAGEVVANRAPTCSRPGDPAGPGYILNTPLTLTARSTTPYTYADWDASPELAKPPGWTVLSTLPLLTSVEPVARQVTIGRTGATVRTAFRTCRTLTVDVVGSYYPASGAAPRSAVQPSVAPDCKIEPNLEHRYEPDTTVELQALVNNATPAPALADTDVRDLLEWRGDGQTALPTAASVEADRPCATRLERCLGNRVVRMDDADRRVTAQLFRPGLCAGYTTSAEPNLPAPVLDRVRELGGGEHSPCPAGTYPTSQSPVLGHFTEVFLRAGRPAGFDGLVSWETQASLPAGRPGETTPLDGVACGPGSPDLFVQRSDQPRQRCYQTLDGTAYELHMPAHGPFQAHAWFCQGVDPTVTLLNTAKQTRQNLGGEAAAGFFTTSGQACPNLPGGFLIGNSVGVRPSAAPAGFRFKGWTSLPPGATVDPVTNEAVFPLDGTTPTKPVRAVFEVVCVALHPDPSGLTRVVDEPNCPSSPAAENLYIGGTGVILVTDVPHDKAAATGWTNATPEVEDRIDGVPYPQEAFAVLTGEAKLGDGNAAAGTPIHADFRDYTTDEEFGMFVVDATKKLVGIGTTIVAGFYDYVLPGKILTAIESIASGVVNLLDALGVPGMDDVSDGIGQTFATPANCLQCLAKWGFGSADTPPPVRDGEPLPPCDPPPPDPNVVLAPNGTFSSYVPAAPTGAAAVLAANRCDIHYATLAAKAVKTAVQTAQKLKLYWDLYASKDPVKKAAALVKKASNDAKASRNRLFTVIAGGVINLATTEFGTESGLDNPFRNFADFMSECSRNYAMPKWVVDLADPPVTVSGAVTSPDVGGVVTVPASGTYVLTMGVQHTAALPSNATAAAVTAALEALPDVVPGDVAVTGSPNAYTVRFSTTASFPRGTVLGADGADVQPAPLEGAHVAVFAQGSENGVQTVTGADGRYRFEGLRNGPLEVVVNAPFFPQVWFDGEPDRGTAGLVDLSQGPNGVADFVLPALGLTTFGGRITAINGLPIDGATVALFKVVDGTATPVGTGATNADGVYTVDARALPGAYRIYAYKPGYQTRWWDSDVDPPAFAPYTGYAVDIPVDGSGTPISADLILDLPHA